MSLNYFEVGKGIAIFNETTNKIIVVAQGDGTADISGASTTDFPVGSIFTDTLTGKVYTRTGTSAVALDDWGIGASEDYVASQLAVQVSWREPVLVNDNTAWANIAAAETSANAGPTLDKIDGVTITAGDRLLFSNLTSGNDNVYVVSGSSGSWVFTEDTNTLTHGDTVYVITGTSGGQTLTYGSSNTWVVSGSASETELGYIRTFIGKNADGSEMPNYSSTTNVTQSTSLETAIGAVDAAIGSRTYTSQDVVTNDQTVAASINAIEQTFGTGLITNTTANYPLTAQTVWNGGAATITSSLNNLNNAIGDRNYTGNNYVVDGETITASINALDVQLALGAKQENKASNVAVSNTAISSVAVDAAAADVQWQLMVKESATATKIESMIIHALVTDAGVVDFSVFAKQKGTFVSGLTITVVKSGSNLELRISASNNVTYVAQVQHVLKF